MNAWMLLSAPVFNDLLSKSFELRRARSVAERGAVRGDRVVSAAEALQNAQSNTHVSKNWKGQHVAARLGGR